MGFLQTTPLEPQVLQYNVSQVFIRACLKVYPKIKKYCLGPENSLVSLKAVDRAAYFLYNGSRLTRRIMFDKMASFDQGCSRRGGSNGQEVFWVSIRTCFKAYLTLSLP